MDTIPYLCDPVTGGCSGTCGQGECLGSVNASRAALGLKPLPTTDPDATAMHPIRMAGGDELAQPTPTESTQAGRAVTAWLVAIFCAAALAAAWAQALSI